MKYIDQPWSIEDWEYVRHGRMVWVVAGGKEKLPSGSVVGPTYICQTTHELAERIVQDHNKNLS